MVYCNVINTEKEAIMFWKHKSPEEKAIERKIKQNVKKVDGVLWGYMVNQGDVSVDELVKYRTVSKEAEDQGKRITRIRFFDPRLVEESGAAVIEYDDLDQYPDFVKHQCISFLDESGNITLQKD
jgi:hypothetical protein